MAFSNATVRKNANSGGGGGGSLAVYDTQATKAQIKNASYWSQAETGQAARERAAVESFIELQQNGSGTTGSGVIIEIIGSDGTEVGNRARLLASGRVRALAP